MLLSYADGGVVLSFYSLLYRLIVKSLIIQCKIRVKSVCRYEGITFWYNKRFFKRMLFSPLGKNNKLYLIIALRGAYLPPQAAAVTNAVHSRESALLQALSLLPNSPPDCLVIHPFQSTPQTLRVWAERKFPLPTLSGRQFLFYFVK